MTEWRCALPAPDLRPGEIHVWRCNLDLSDAEQAAARALLSPGEIKQADRFVMEPPRRSFTACRALARTLLGRYLGQDPREIAIELGEFGKPELAGEAGGRLSFNVSHSDGWALLGVTLEGRLGVDIERRRLLRDMDMVADTCFSPTELAAYTSASSADKVETFYNGWTRKEAFIKAVGKGLVFPLRDFDVSIELAAEPRILRIVGDSTEPGEWTLFGFEALEGYAAAIALDRPGATWLALDGDEFLRPALLAAASI